MNFLYFSTVKDWQWELKVTLWRCSSLQLFCAWQYKPTLRCHFTILTQNSFSKDPMRAIRPVTLSTTTWGTSRVITSDMNCTSLPPNKPTASSRWATSSRYPWQSQACSTIWTLTPVPAIFSSKESSLKAPQLRNTLAIYVWYRTLSMWSRILMEVWWPIWRNYPFALANTSLKKESLSLMMLPKPLKNLKD